MDVFQKKICGSLLPLLDSKEEKKYCNKVKQKTLKTKKGKFLNILGI